MSNLVWWDGQGEREYMYMCYGKLGIYVRSGVDWGIGITWCRKDNAIPGVENKTKRIRQSFWSNYDIGPKMGEVNSNSAEFQETEETISLLILVQDFATVYYSSFSIDYVIKEGWRWIYEMCIRYQ